MFLYCLGRGRQGAAGLRELDAAVRRAREDGRFRVVLALLPGADPSAVNELPSVLRKRLAFDFREGFGDIQALIRFVDEDQPEFRPVPEFELAGRMESDRVDPREGITLDRDDLALGTYATMLATAIADRGNPMPLSIGLFGEWGSGKSYFMGLLRQQVSELAASDADRYCGEIAQISFNAWHYSDANLWASLGDEIFRQLTGPDAGIGEKREHLRAQLAARLDSVKELEAVRDEMKSRTVTLRKDLDRAASDRTTQAGIVARAVSKELWAEFKVTEGGAQIDGLARELEAGKADVEVSVRNLAGPRGRAIIAVGVLLLLGLVVVAATERWVATTPVLAALGVWAGGARVYAGVIARRISRLAERVRVEEGKALAKEVELLRTAEADVALTEAELERLSDEVGELGREIAVMSPGQQLYGFLASRANGDSYRSHLGLVSTIRKDFEQLVQLMKELQAKRAGGGEGTRPFERIVLYIDDLDRCSARQVVEVLQAVHLLLAFDLFAVVVGVDPRWLLRSLETHHLDQLGSGRGDGAGAVDWLDATPEDYLQKIFSVPFVLPPMSADGFAGIVAGAARREQRATAPDLERRVEAASSVSSKTAEAGSVSGRQDAAVVVEAASEVAALLDGGEPIESRPLTAEEIDLFSALAPLVTTPREAKRLMNVYRMLRSTRDLSPAARFLGTPGEPGEYQAVAVLLGIAAGAPQLFPAIAAHLTASSSGQRWSDFVAGMAPAEGSGSSANAYVNSMTPADAARWSRLYGALSEVTRRVELTDLDAFKRWTPAVSRFTFHAPGA